MMSHVEGIVYDHRNQRVEVDIPVETIYRVDTTNAYGVNPILYRDKTGMVTFRIGRDVNGVPMFLTAFVPLAQLGALGIMDFHCNRCEIITRARNAFADKSSAIITEAYYNLDAYLTKHQAFAHPYNPY